MPHSKLQLRVLVVYKRILRQLQQTADPEASLQTARQIFKENAKNIEKSNFILVEHNLRLAERRLDNLKRGGVERVSTFTIKRPN
ncbi:unnamed protein product [Bursaphelenchus xylophilus]|uniref:(pine wood nematode) hypothetical protein n=1 Tax=Bursaphelenchus xylophilus TaxID=6326 RepID=A0A1I7RIS2_BURXY|nr:unnamed protein product [Bursaphelenchus xylophilus]CAG9119054.1 unnamed protein product [Bursaphelenchus xylophilus]